MDGKSKTCCTPARDVSTSMSCDDKLLSKAKESIKAPMQRIDGQRFLMGADSKNGFPDDGEGPVRKVSVDPFLISATAVSNKQFKAFIDATGYKTDAEKYGWSFVFKDFLAQKDLKKNLPSPKKTPWWKGVEEAQWNHPEGPESTIHHRMNHPVVHVSWNDAATYCDWAGMRLPTEAEWECAARGGLEQKKYAWGDELVPNDEHQCNIWQGKFPDKNTEADGFTGTAPVDTYQPNGYGLYNIAGNVWEWCIDWFSASYPLLRIKDNPTGPGSGTERVIRGGSYLCHHSYCNRYRVAARTANTPGSSTGNMGFRCAKNVKEQFSK